MTKPRVSFVIPVLNGEKDIARCLLSVQNLQFPRQEYEVLILDNGSTDQTHRIIHELNFDFKIIPKLRVGALRNRGATIAQGDYLAFVDADVELTPYWVQRGLEAFADPRIVAGGCFPKVPEGATWVQRAWDIHQRGSHFDSRPWSAAWLPSMNLIVRRDVFMVTGGFNEQLETAEDVDLCYRLGHRGVILYNPAMEAIHWGEAKDLRAFWHKEIWRGRGNLHGILSHGFRWDELPSLGYPLYVLGMVLLFTFSCIFAIWHWRVTLISLTLLLIALPALVLSTVTTWRAGKLKKLPQLFVLYFVYGFARAYALIKAGVPCRA